MNSGFVELHSKGDTSSGLKRGQSVFVAIDRVMWIAAKNLSNDKTSGSIVILSNGSHLLVSESVEDIQEKFSNAFAEFSYAQSIRVSLPHKQEKRENGKK